jgi:hypothetical protein
MMWQDGGGTDNNRSGIMETAVRAVIVPIERAKKNVRDSKNHLSPNCPSES